jgi:hypothetical protein
MHPIERSPDTQPGAERSECFAKANHRRGRYARADLPNTCFFMCNTGVDDRQYA